MTTTNKMPADEKWLLDKDAIEISCQNPTTDFYADFYNFYHRLEYEYHKFGRLIIAVDFDDTLSDYHKTGKTFDNIIPLLQFWKDYAFIYIWTARNEERQKEVVEYCKEKNIHFENINLGCTDNPNVDFDSRKPFYSVLLDDRCGLNFPILALQILQNRIERGYFESKDFVKNEHLDYADDENK